MDRDQRANHSKRGYYVMQEMDGEECLLWHVATLREARAKVRDYVGLRHEYLSIWNAGGTIVEWRKPATVRAAVLP